MVIPSNCSRNPSSNHEEDLESSVSSFNVLDLGTGSKNGGLVKDTFDTEERTSSVKVTKKSVTFHEIVKYREIPRCNNMSRRQREQLWETSESLLRSRRDALEIVEMMNCGLELAHDVGQRGLSWMCQAEKTKRNTVRIEAYTAVLLLQELQFDLWSLYDDRGDITEAIGRQYAKLSQESKKEALRRGENDHDAAVESQL